MAGFRKVRMVRGGAVGALTFRSLELKVHGFIV
jgi:hypothetical protein